MRAWLLTIVLALPIVALADDAPNMDPWEGFNRAIFSFNQGADTYFFRPLAIGYKAITPAPVDKSVGHFFSNLDDIRVVVNDVAQLKFGQAFADTARFLINSTVGFFGFFDVATHIGLAKHQSDFGLTLGYWGVESGPYLVLPFLGSSTLRDTTGLAITYFDGLSYLDMGANPEEGYALTLVYAISLRSRYLGSESLISGDPYTFMRSMYFQRRAFMLSELEGNKDVFEDDTWEEFEDLEI